MQHSRPADALPKKCPTSVKPNKSEMEKQLRGQPTEDNAIRMARRAYEIYRERISRGPLDDWLEAEREIASHEPAE